MKSLPDYSAQKSSDDRHYLFPVFLFEKEFSIDWAVELLGLKVSDTLEIIEKEVQNGLLQKKAAGQYTFNPEKQKEITARCSAEELDQGHRQIADLLLRELPDDQQKPLFIAPHLLKSSVSHENFHWLTRAGDIFIKNFLYKEAFQCFQKILEELAELRGENYDYVFVEAAVKYSKISIGSEDTEKVLSILYEALSRAREKNKQSCQSLLQMHIAKNKWLLSEYKSAMNHFEMGWNIAKQLNDPKLLRSAKTFSSFFLYWQGRIQEVVESFEKSVTDVEHHPKGTYPLIATALAAYCYCLIGQIPRGLGILNSVHKYCIEQENFYAASRSSLNLGKVMLEIGETDRALQYFDIASQEAIQGKNNFVLISSKLLLAYSNYLNENNDQAIAYLKNFVSLREQVNILVQPYPYLLELLWAMEEGKLPRLFGLSFEKIISQMIQDDNIFMRGVAYRFKAMMLKKKEDAPQDRLNTLIRTSIKWLEKSGHKPQLARSLIESARLNLSMNRTKKAKKNAQRAFQILSEFNRKVFPNDLRTLVTEKKDDKDFLKEILRLGQELVSIREDREMVQHIISTANRITGAERGAIFLLEKEENEPKLQLRASKGLTAHQISDPAFEGPMKLIREVADTGESRINNINSQTECYSCPNEVIRSQICVPMILKGEVIGVLYHDNCFLCNAFNNFDIELLSYFATFAGFAVERSRAWEEVKRLNKKLEEENQYYETEHLETLNFEDIVGESDAIKKVLNQIKQVSKTDSTVLIYGETGVGKELVARAIHRLSERGKQPFIRLNCSSYPESLISSELFGHEKGAFTGANSRRVGRFELADTGTLFLDEVGELSMEIQIRLLQVLQLKEFERVGGNETIYSDFRLLAATNQDLQQLIKEGRFRSDLFYRLNVFPIYVPPLRERKEDIPLLAYYFLKIYNTKMRKNVKDISDRDMNRLIKYHWPGNVRELDNIIERGTILSSGTRFKMPELHQDSKFSENEDAGLTLKENEKNHILWAMNKTEWKIRGLGGAAELLDIHPSTLSFRMKKLGIQRPKEIPKKRSAHAGYGY